MIMNKDEKQSIKEMYRAKNVKWAINSDATERKNDMTKVLKTLKAENSFYDLQFNDIYKKGFALAVKRQKEYAILNDSLFCLTRVNGQLESYEFLMPNQTGSYSYIKCKTSSVGLEHPSLTLSTAGFCIEIIYENNGKFVCDNFQYIGNKVWDMDKNCEPSAQDLVIAKNAREIILEAQDLFGAIKNTFAFQARFEKGLKSGEVSFGKRGGYFGNETPRQALVFSFENGAVEEPTVIFTPRSQNAFQTINKNSKIYLPLNPVHYATDDGLKRIANLDFIDLPLVVDAFKEDVKDKEKAD